MNTVGIDTGGTFTDFVWVDDDGRLQTLKVASTPDDPAQAIAAGLSQKGLADVAHIVHGSTVATNALLERRGARTALIATAGFGDVIEIGRQNRAGLYALRPEKPPPLVPRDQRYEVEERVSAYGEVLAAPDPSDVQQLAARLLESDVESIAICLLFSFLRPEHERLIAAAVRSAFERQDRPINLSLSSEIMPEYREYERTAATVINAYVAPLMAGYLSRLVTTISPRSLVVMQSNGGLINARAAGDQAVRTVLSGPAGGVVGAMYVAAAAEQLRSDVSALKLITFDMGGTSTDVALCPGEIPTTTTGSIAGLPLRLPLIDIHTVGAGGGSLAYVDTAGALHVGPESAGASPGPACYRADYAGWRMALDAHFRPGLATVSDANLVLGRLDAGHFLGGKMRLYETPAGLALQALAAATGADSPHRAAWDLVRVANANMERAIRRISVERGYDPRRFTLVAFGGGGPLHACELAERMAIPEVLIPPTPGVLSALGMLAASPTRSYAQTVLHSATVPESAVARLDEQIELLRVSAAADMAAEGHQSGQLAQRVAVDMRYLGQSHELTIPFDRAAGLSELVDAFHRAHAQRYGYARREAEVELVTLRLTVAAAADPPQPTRLEYGGPDAGGAHLAEKSIWFDQGFVSGRAYARESLLAGNQIAGPAVIYQYDTTTVIPPGWLGIVDELANLRLRRS